MRDLFANAPNWCSMSIFASVFASFCSTYNKCADFNTNPYPIKYKKHTAFLRRFANTRSISIIRASTSCKTSSRVSASITAHRISDSYSFKSGHISEPADFIRLGYIPLSVGLQVPQTMHQLISQSVHHRCPPHHVPHPL